MTGQLKFSIDDGIARLLLDRPERMNAFTFDMIMTNIDPNFGKAYDIENIDPAEAEKLSGNLLRVKKLSVDEALRKYGKEMHH